MRAEATLIEAGQPVATSAGGSLLDELMTTNQVAAALQMRVSTVDYYARHGVLPCLKLGRHRRFLRSEIERAICDAVADREPTCPRRATHSTREALRHRRA